MHSTYKYILSTYWFVSGTYQNILGTYLVHTLSARPLTMSFISTPILRISKYWVHPKMYASSTYTLRVCTGYVLWWFCIQQAFVKNCSGHVRLDINLLKPSSLRLEFVHWPTPLLACQIHRHPSHSGWSTSTGLHILFPFLQPTGWRHFD